MKFSESWLRDWANPSLNRDALCELLTMSGLEVEEVKSVAEKFSGVIVGEVLEVKPHPDAERLTVCKVNIGSSQLTIVCGATNVRPHIKVPVAVANSILPNQKKITDTTIRGIASQGMLCSASELGLAEESDGLFELPSDAPLGEDVYEYLKLDDYLIELGITPNRGDCLSILGLAKEVSALTECKLNLKTINEIPSTIEDKIKISIKNTNACPRYVGRIIRGVNAGAPTPIWLREHLRRSGIRSISAVVDIMNYVMLELGQPMHAFSLDKIDHEIIVRNAKAHEKLILLDESEVELDDETLVIADQTKPLAIAGIMGGLDSGVTLQTKDILLESAFFTVETIARTARHFHLASDSAYRFERGIDPLLQRLAIERATDLVLTIAGGEAGPINEVVANDSLPQPVVIKLREKQIKKILGFEITVATIEALLDRLGFVCKRQASGWDVKVPARRSDIKLEIDLIEEVARLYGYDKIPVSDPKTFLQIHSIPENQLDIYRIKQALTDLGYNEVITYNFVDKKLQDTLFPDLQSKPLINPMTHDMGVMRTSLLPGLLNTLIYNQNRQQSRLKIFEIGQRFVVINNELHQIPMLAGLITGTAMPEQWGIPERNFDFYDLKGDIENIVNLTLSPHEFTFKTDASSVFHPGQSAEITRNGQSVGFIGALHPTIAQSLKLEGNIFAFELQLDQIERAKVPSFTSISKFPEIRRDIAILLEHSVPAVKVQDTIREVADELLKAIDIFDVYQGKGIREGHKSIALALTLQHPSRTLVDEEVADLMERVIETLKGRFNAELRG